MPTVNDQDGAIDVTGRAGTKEDCRRFDIFDQSKSAQRDPFPELVLDGFRHQTLHAFGVADRTGRNCIHANAVTSPLDREVFRQSIDASLGRRDMQLHRRAQVVQRRTDVQDLALMLLQLIESRAANIERALQIDIHDRAKTVGRKFFRRAKKVSGCAVHYDIDFAESFNGGRDGLLNFFGVAHVGGDGKGFAHVVWSWGALANSAPRFIDCLRGGLEMFHPAAHQGNVRPSFSQRAGYPAGNARATPGHEGNMAFENSISKYFHVLWVVGAGLFPALPAVNVQFGQGQALPLQLPTRNKRPGLDDVDLTVHVGPFDVLVFIAKYSLDPRGCSS